MPHTPCAKKRLRQNIKRRSRNRADLKTLKKQLKKLTGLIPQGPAEQIQAEFKVTVKKLDKAAARRVIHPNSAARKKSQLTRMIRAKTSPAQ